ncbi:hypothetical protein AGMMS49940_15350 [Spirochaetia bacterium]|nr:hypothetical protein AGMMS49940_15350 [Spirochaetia bacterium]
MAGIDLIGQRFGRLTVMGLDHADKKRYWKCLCDCGKEAVVQGDKLKMGRTKSCGCYRAEFGSKIGSIKTHGLTNTVLFSRWHGMLDRCYREKAQNYYNYGGRGITVCNEWRNNFQAFYDWAMENGFDESLTIDRIDENGNYEPGNCRWATSGQQSINKRNTIILEYKGEEKTLVEWAEQLKLSRAILYKRIKRYKWDIEKAFTTPIGGTNAFA